MPYNQISRYANFMAWLGWFLVEYVSSNFKLHLYVTDAYFLSPAIAKCRVISILGGSDWAEVSRVSHCGHYPRQMRHIDDSDSANYQQLFSFLIKHSISILYFSVKCSHCSAVSSHSIKFWNDVQELRYRCRFLVVLVCW